MIIPYLIVAVAFAIVATYVGLVGRWLNAERDDLPSSRPVRAVGANPSRGTGTAIERLASASRP